MEDTFQKIAKSMASMSGMTLARKAQMIIAAPVVAQTIGIDNTANSIDDLPTGFRLNFQAAMLNEYFDEAKTIGDFVAGYCRYIIDQVE